MLSDLHNSHRTLAPASSNEHISDAQLTDRCVLPQAYVTGGWSGPGLTVKVPVRLRFFRERLFQLHPFPAAIPPPQ